MTDETRIPSRRAAEDCPPEWIYSIYIDRELEPGEMHEVEVHLADCRSCRELASALEVETTALRAALRVEALASTPARATPAVRGLAMGVGSALAGAFVFLLALGWIAETRIPSPMEWLNPLKPTGAFSLFFDTMSMVRNEAPVFYQLLVYEALAGVVLSLLVSIALATRRFQGPGTAALLIFGWAATLLVPTPASAFELLFSEEVATVPAGEVVEQTWVTSADTVTIEGTLRGDLIVLGDRVTISGTLDGNLVSAARKVEISGRVTGFVLSFGERLHIGGEVDRNVYAAVRETTLAESGRVGRDFVAAGEGVVISGVVGRDAMTFNTWLEVRGKIERDLEVRAERLEVMSGARVGGDLRAVDLEGEASVEIDPSATIGGETTIERVENELTHYLDRYKSARFYFLLAISFAAAFLSGMVAFRLAPWMFDSEISSGSDFFRALAHGFVTLIVAPIGLGVLALTIIGIPVAIIGSVVYVACLYFAKVAVGVLIGISIFGRPEESDWSGFGRTLVVGLATVYVATSIPYLGEVVRVVTLLTGFGAIVYRMRVHIRVGD